MGDHSGLDFLVSDGWKAQVIKDGLDRLRCPPANRQDLSFSYRAKAAVYLHIALQDRVVIQIFRIKIAAAKQIVFSRHGTITGKNKISSGQKLEHQLGGLAYLRMRGHRVITGSHFQIQKGGN